jgi:[FeFe] hydrogenase H-cluster maturation GTPase HydF
MARVDRLIVGIFGRVNAGKSTLMNLLTRHETSIVDPKPGTTADIKSAVMEVHALGPVQLLDTAGIDESGALGEKKRKKAFWALEEVDLAVLVVDPVQVAVSADIKPEERLADLARQLGKKLVMIFNIHADAASRASEMQTTIEEAKAFCRRALPDPGACPSLASDLTQVEEIDDIVGFIASNKPDPLAPVPLLPFIKPQGAVLLHIPLDEESPAGRLLRPQEMAMEYLLRLTAPVGLYRCDLTLARSASPTIRSYEKERFVRFLKALGGAEPVQLVLTDSQAVDIMHQWVPPKINLTTFSVMMINQSSAGDLARFVEGAKELDSLKGGDRILIAEACNHDRIAEDIGTVQIPRGIAKRIPGVEVDHVFGRDFPPEETLSKYKLVIHCGGCMISRQKLKARVERLSASRARITNYGLVLSWLHSSEALTRVLKPWIA